jgi:hypothetical protein
VPVEPPPHPARDKTVPKHISETSSLSPTMTRILLGILRGARNSGFWMGTVWARLLGKFKVKVGPGVGVRRAVQSTMRRRSSVKSSRCLAVPSTTLEGHRGQIPANQFHL